MLVLGGGWRWVNGRWYRVAVVVVAGWAGCPWAVVDGNDGGQRVVSPTRPPNRRQLRGAMMTCMGNMFVFGLDSKVGAGPYHTHSTLFGGTPRLPLAPPFHALSPKLFNQSFLTHPGDEAAPF